MFLFTALRPDPVPSQRRGVGCGRLGPAPPLTGPAAELDRRGVDVASVRPKEDRWRRAGERTELVDHVCLVVEAAGRSSADTQRRISRHESDANNRPASSRVHRSSSGTIRSTSSDAGTSKTSGVTVKGRTAPTAWTVRPTRRIRAWVKGPTTHTRGETWMFRIQDPELGRVRHRRSSEDGDSCRRCP